MENEPVNPVESPSKLSNKLTRRPRLKIAAIVIVALIALTVGYLLLSNYVANKNNSSAEKVLSIADLENASADLSGGTSDASVDNLSKELKDRIDKQIADKENPIETVRTLVGVLCNTANAKRPTQCVDYITNFLDTKMDTLKFKSDFYGTPDETRINQWRARFYSDLAYGYQFIMDNKFAQKDGSSFDTSADQLKYVKMYLDIAQDPKNWGEPQTSEDGGRTWYLYEYPDTTDFIEWRQRLEAGVAQ